MPGWKHVQRPHYCENCIFWEFQEFYDEQRDNAWGWCRIDTPRISIVSPDAEMSHNRGMWPWTDRKDWCGSWQEGESFEDSET